MLGNINYIYDDVTLETNTTYDPIISTVENYMEYSYDDVVYSRMSATSDATLEYYSLTDTTLTLDSIEMTNISIGMETGSDKLTRINEDYYVLLSFENPITSEIGNISIDGIVHDADNEVSPGYIISDDGKDIAIPLQTPLIEDGKITHVVNYIEVLDFGTYEQWDIDNSISIAVYLTIQQNITVLSTVLDKSNMEFGESYNLFVTIDNPTSYPVVAITVDDVVHTPEGVNSFTINGDNTIITIPYTNSIIYGDVIHIVNNIQFNSDDVVEVIEIENLISNGDFSNTLVDWGGNGYSTLDAVNNILSVAGNGLSSGVTLEQLLSNPDVADKMFLYQRSRVTNSDCSLMGIQIYDESFDEYLGYIAMQSDPIINEWYELYGLFSIPVDFVGGLQNDITYHYVSYDRGTELTK
mgnify:CR=1 FL=1